MIVVAILFALIVALLAIPFDVKFSIQRHEKFHSDIAVQWLFGVVKFSIANQTKAADNKPRKIKKNKKTKKKPKNKPANVSAVMNLLWNARFRYRLLKFVKDVFKTIHIASFYLRLRLGLDDPADTGRLWTFFGPLDVFVSNLSRATVHLEPDFQTEIVYLDSRGKVRIVPLQVVFTVFAFVFSPITVSALWTAFTSSRQ